MTTYNTRVAKIADGTTTRWAFAFAGGYILPEHVKISIEGGEGTVAVLETEGTAVIEPALAAGTKFDIYRDTPTDDLLVDWSGGADISENSLDVSTKQPVFAAEEAKDAISVGLEDVVTTEEPRTIYNVAADDYLVITATGDITGKASADLEAIQTATEAARDETDAMLGQVYALSNAVEVDSYDQGMLVTLPGQSFVVFSENQIRRYKNGTSQDVTDPVFVFPEGPVPDPSEVAPSANWTGVAGSGFTSTPVDPARVTAKPAMRLIVPEHQRFTDTLTVGVSAFAANSGSLLGGVSKVTFYFEGGEVDVTEPTFKQFTRANGTSYLCLGYWAVLKKPDGAAGAANVYVEATPTDSALQNRVIGPFAFYPQVALYDQDVTVGASGDYADIAAAITALKALTPDSARIQLLDNGDYPVSNGGVDYIGDSYLVIEPAEGVSARLVETGGPSTGGLGWRTKYGRMWLRDLSIDMDTITQLYNDAGGDAVLERCSFVATAQLWFGGVRNVSYMVRDNPVFLDCDFQGCYEVGNGATLLRGNTGENCWGDFTSQCPAVLYNEIHNQDYKSFGDTIDVVTVNYSGGGTATLSKTANNAGPASNRTQDYVMKVDGAQVGTTLQIWQQWTHYNDGDSRYWVEDFVSWVNGLPDFAATALIPAQTRQARAINKPGSTTNSDFVDLAIGSSINLVSDFDFHTDGIVSAAFENGVHSANRLTKFDGQAYFMAASGTYSDVVCVNNVFQGVGNQIPYSQIVKGDFEHMVAVHNTWARQILNVGTSGATFDSYCTVSSNSAWNIVGDATGVTANSNHLASDGLGLTASGLTGTQIGGTEDTNYVDADAFDFTPTGSLALKFYAPLTSHDLNSTARTGEGPVGAVTL